MITNVIPRLTNIVYPTTLHIFPLPYSSSSSVLHDKELLLHGNRQNVLFQMFPNLTMSLSCSHVLKALCYFDSGNQIWTAFCSFPLCTRFSLGETPSWWYVLIPFTCSCSFVCSLANGNEQVSFRVDHLVPLLSAFLWWNWKYPDEYFRHFLGDSFDFGRRLYATVVFPFQSWAGVLITCSNWQSCKFQNFFESKG